MTQPRPSLGHIVAAACDVCGISSTEFFAKQPGQSHVMVSRARMLAVVAAVKLDHRPNGVCQWLRFSTPMVSQLRSLYADRVKLGDERLSRAVATVKTRAAAMVAAGTPGLELPGKPKERNAKAHLPPVTFTRMPKPPRLPHAKPGPKAKSAPPRESVPGPTVYLPADEVQEARELRRKGWSMKGLTRRFELPEDQMRIVLGEVLA